MLYPPAGTEASVISTTFDFGDSAGLLQDLIVCFLGSRSFITVLGMIND